MGGAIFRWYGVVGLSELKPPTSIFIMVCFYTKLGPGAILLSMDNALMLFVMYFYIVSMFVHTTYTELKYFDMHM